MVTSEILYTVNELILSCLKVLNKTGRKNRRLLGEASKVR